MRLQGFVSAADFRIFGHLLVLATFPLVSRFICFMISLFLYTISISMAGISSGSTNLATHI